MNKRIDLASEHFSPLRLVFYPAGVAVLGGLSVVCGERLGWTWFPPSSFGNVGEWVGATATGAALLAIGHQLATDRDATASTAIHHLLEDMPPSLILNTMLDGYLIHERRPQPHEAGEQKSWYLAAIRTCSLYERDDLVKAFRKIATLLEGPTSEEQWAEIDALVESIRPSSENTPDKNAKLS